MAMGRKNSGMIWFLVNAVFGLYFLNKGLNFIDISKMITASIDNGIMVIGGALIIISGVMYLMRRPAPGMYR